MHIWPIKLRNHYLLKDNLNNVLVASSNNAKPKNKNRRLGREN